MTKTYELMVLAKPEFDGTDSKKAQGLVQKLVGDQGTIKDVTNLGKKQLSYPMQKFTEAHFFLTNIESPALRVSDLEKQMKLEGGDVLRFLLIAKEG